MAFTTSRMGDFLEDAAREDVKRVVLVEDGHAIEYQGLDCPFEKCHHTRQQKSKHEASFFSTEQVERAATQN